MYMQMGRLVVTRSQARQFIWPIRAVASTRCMRANAVCFSTSTASAAFSSIL